MKIKNYIYGILGLWLIISAPIGSAGFNSINNLFIGIILIVVSMYTTEGKTVYSWIVSIIGLWLIIAAFISGLISGLGLYLNNIINGLLIVGMGVFQILHPKYIQRHISDDHHDFRNFGAE
jgi:hypothetical protein